MEMADKQYTKELHKYRREYNQEKKRKSRKQLFGNEDKENRINLREI